MADTEMEAPRIIGNLDEQWNWWDDEWYASVDRRRPVRDGKHGVSLDMAPKGKAILARTGNGSYRLIFRCTMPDTSQLRELYKGLTKHLECSYRDRYNSMFYGDEYFTLSNIKTKHEACAIAELFENYPVNGPYIYRYIQRFNYWHSAAYDLKECKSDGFRLKNTTASEYEHRYFVDKSGTLFRTRIVGDREIREGVYYEPFSADYRRLKPYVQKIDTTPGRHVILIKASEINIFEWPNGKLADITDSVNQMLCGQIEASPLVLALEYGIGVREEETDESD
ncbi:hypothetical protein [Bifidobacterium pseudolongum]|uniref:hypothetical protein n=1 Tax=Bifidobacterium pseudolongum TaxID=1694 RepID=UPI0015D649A5|nr:hypothetical protein [Bifidobacterium pseudolongum]